MGVSVIEEGLEEVMNNRRGESADDVSGVLGKKVSDAEVRSTGLLGMLQLRY